MDSGVWISSFQSNKEVLCFFMRMFAHLLGKSTWALINRRINSPAVCPLARINQLLSCKPDKPIPSNSNKKLINISEDLQVAQGVIVGGYMARKMSKPYPQNMSHWEWDLTTYPETLQGWARGPADDMTMAALPETGLVTAATTILTKVNPKMSLLPESMSGMGVSDRQSQGHVSTYRPPEKGAVKQV